MLPRGFHFLDRKDDALFLPMQWDRNKMKLGNFSYRGLARLKPGVTMQQASTDMARLLPIPFAASPRLTASVLRLFEKANFQPNLRPLKQDVVGDVGNVLWVLMGSIVMVLLVACANVANLLLVRVEGRRQELAIRSALGAGWKRITADLLMESALLGALGAAIGLALAYGALRLLVYMAPTGLPRIHEIGINLPVLLFTLGLAVITSVLIGLIPVMKYAGGNSASGLREGGRALSQSRERHRARKILVVVQVALALVLLICSGLMIRTFRAMMQVSPGFTGADALQTFRIYIPETQIPDAQRDRDRPHGTGDSGQARGHPGRLLRQLFHCSPDGWKRLATIAVVCAGPRLRRGRTAAHPPLQTRRARKLRHARHAADRGTRSHLDRHVPEAAGRHHLGELSRRSIGTARRTPSGKRIRVANTDDWREIVGVAGDVHDDGVSLPAPTTVYWPLMQDRFEGQKEMRAARRRVTMCAARALARRSSCRRCSGRCGRSTPTCLSPMSRRWASITPSPWRGPRSRW